MPVATLTFNLPEEETEFRQAVNASSWQHVCWELDQHLRSAIKYADSETPEAVVNALQLVREYLNEQRIEHSLSWD